jgi:hypothetical protein
MIKRKTALFNKEESGKGNESIITMENEKTVAVMYEAGIVEMNLSEGVVIQDPLIGG